MTTPNYAAMFQWASERGLFMFPVTAGEKRPLAGIKWKELASNNPVHWAQWTVQNPNINFGVYAAKSGMLIVDIDVKRSEIDPTGNGGHIEWARLCAEHNIPASPSVQSRSSGLHYYLKADEAIIQQLGLGHLKQSTIHPNIDTRYQGYVLAPYSIAVADGDPVLRPYLPFDGSQIQWAQPSFIDYVAKHQNSKSANSDGQDHSEQSLVPLDMQCNIDVYTRLLLNTKISSTEGDGGHMDGLNIANAAHDLGLSTETMYDLMVQHWDDRNNPPWGDELWQRCVGWRNGAKENVMGSGADCAGMAIMRLKDCDVFGNMSPELAAHIATPPMLSDMDASIQHLESVWEAKKPEYQAQAAAVEQAFQNVIDETARAMGDEVLSNIGEITTFDEKPPAPDLDPGIAPFFVEYLAAPRQITELHAKEKSGKTTALVGTLFHGQISNSTPMGDNSLRAALFEVPYNVIYVAAEGGDGIDKVIRDHKVANGFSYEGNDSIFHVVRNIQNITIEEKFEKPKPDPSLVAQLVMTGLKATEKNGRPNLYVFDSLAQLISNDTDRSEVQGFINMLRKDIIGDTNNGIVLVTHTTKDGGKVRGTGILGALVDASLTLSTYEEKNVYTHIKGNDKPIRPDVYTMEPNGKKFKVTRGAVMRVNFWRGQNSDYVINIRTKTYFNVHKNITDDQAKFIMSKHWTKRTRIEGRLVDSIHNHVIGSVEILPSWTLTPEFRAYMETNVPSKPPKFGSITDPFGLNPNPDHTNLGAKADAHSDKIVEEIAQNNEAKASVSNAKIMQVYERKTLPSIGSNDPPPTIPVKTYRSSKAVFKAFSEVLQ